MRGGLVLMHPKMLHEVIERCRQREREGDCPTVPPFGVEILESAVAELAKPEPRTFPLKFGNDWLERKIRSDPDIEADVKPRHPA